MRLMRAMMAKNEFKMGKDSYGKRTQVDFGLYGQIKNEQVMAVV